MWCMGELLGYYGVVERRSMTPKEDLLPHITQAAFHLWDQLEVDHLNPHIPINVCSITPWEVYYVWEPWE